MRLATFSAFLIIATFMIGVGTATADDTEFDYNGDGAVDEVDLEILMSHFNSAEGDDGYDPAFDHDSNGYIGGTDYAAALRAASE